MGMASQRDDYDVGFSLYPTRDPSFGLAISGPLGADDAFDATSVDPWSIEMAGAVVAARKRGKRLMARNEDVNEDGLPDLVVHFRTPDLAPELLADGWAELTAVTFAGPGIEGVDHVRLVPKKRHRK